MPETGTEREVSTKLEKIFSVSEYIQVLNEFFRKHKTKIIGEISEFKRASSGHVYLTLKDKTALSALDAIIWSRNYQLCGARLEAGMEVILYGSPDIYAQTGRFSFVADTVELVGEGTLKKAYDELKNKLELEGLFDPARKRPLPEFVNRIGVITSLKGAVIHDFTSNLGKFGFKVIVADSRVEGQQAVSSILAGLELMKNGGIEALVIMRGGGSLESLQAFNNEFLVRQIADFPQPVIAAIGHDKDIPLIALAADFMPSTPTAAAHLLNRSFDDAFRRIRELSAICSRFPSEISRQKIGLENYWSKILNYFWLAFKEAEKQIQMAERSIRLNDPRRPLKLGYSIVRAGGKILKNSKSVKIGGELNIELHQGRLKSEIREIENG